MLYSWYLFDYLLESISMYIQSFKSYLSYFCIRKECLCNCA